MATKFKTINERVKVTKKTVVCSGEPDNRELHLARDFADRTPQVRSRLVEDSLHFGL